MTDSKDEGIRAERPADHYRERSPGETSRLEVAFQLRVEDYLAFQEYHLSRRAGAGRTGLRHVVLVLLLLALISLILVLGEPNWLDPVPLALFIVLALLIGVFLFRRPLLWAATRRNLSKDRTLFRTTRVTLSPEAVEWSRGPSESRTLWEGIEKVGVTETHLFLYISSFQALVVPGRAFASEVEFDDFIDAARHYRRSARRRLEED